MRAGELRHQVHLMEPTHTNDGYGGITTAWGTATVCWGAMLPLKGREWIESGMENSEVIGKCRLRYISGVTPDMRLVYNSRTYEIVSVIDPYERHRELELMLKELVEA